MTNIDVWPLHETASNGHTEDIQLLIDLGADVNAKTTWRDAPLHKAAYGGHTEAIQLLIDLGADADADGY